MNTPSKTEQAELIEAKNREKQFLPISYTFYDGGFCAVLSPSTRSVYEILKTYTWRDPTYKENRTLAKRYRKLQLVCKISQGKVAAIAGMSTRNVRRSIQELKELGWIRVEILATQHLGNDALYHLGVVDAGTNGSTSERFYAQECMSRMWLAMEKLAQKTTGRTDAQVKDLPFPDRVEFVKKNFKSPEFTGIR